MTSTIGVLARLLLVSGALALLVGCGGDGGGPAQATVSGSSAQLREELDQATRATRADFPAVRGRTLQQVADKVRYTGPEAVLATATLHPGVNRLAFGMIDSRTGFVYGKTAVYVADGPDDRARGPYPAPADLLLTDPPFRSRNAATESDPFAAIYQASVPFPRPGPAAVLVVTKQRDRLIGAATSVRVLPEREDTVPDVGERAPVVETDTVAAAAGDIASIDTRVPPDDMHTVDLADVAGRRPVAILFATPQLCESRVCGPVVDIAEQLKATYGERMAFIHQEVYVENDPNKGLRPPLEAFGLRTEPWLFVLDEDGRVTARLEGSFGFRALEQALRSGLDS